MNRIRLATAPDVNAPRLTGTVEADETYCGGMPRPGDGKIHERGRGTSKTPVFAVVERGGNIRSRVVPDVTGETLKAAIREEVDFRARIITDELSAYKGIGDEFKGGHHTVCHGTREYARGDIHTNTAESSFVIVKRGIMGTYHNVSGEYLHRYLWQFDFLWNNRSMNDGERVVEAVRCAEGKRLIYRMK
jgi:hypothetical protein